MWLLDTNVVSETRKRKPHGGLVAWIDEQPTSALHIAAATIFELQVGAEFTRRNNPAKAAEIEAWIDLVQSDYGIITADAAVCRRWSKLMVGQTADLMIDALIAATAQTNGLTVVTRNVVDFARLGVEVVNPFTTSAGQ